MVIIILNALLTAFTCRRTTNDQLELKPHEILVKVVKRTAHNQNALEII